MTEPRQERAIRTRATIVAAAAVVFDRLGYDLASIAEILNEAKVTKGSLYFHFSSKEALARAVVEAQTTLVRPRQHEVRVQSAIDLTFDVAARLQTDPMMRAGIRLVIERGSWKTSEAGPYLGWIELTEAPLREAKQRGELLPHVAPRQVAELVVGAFTGVQLLSEVLNHRADLPDRVGEFWDFVLPGMVVAGILTRLHTKALAPPALAPPALGA